MGLAAPRWLSYRVRYSIRGGKSENTGGGHVSISTGGARENTSGALNGHPFRVCFLTSASPPKLELQSLDLHSFYIAVGRVPSAGVECLDLRVVLSRKNRKRATLPTKTVL